MISPTAYKRTGVLELRRNPYFKQWSYAAQPAGYPDVIRYVKANEGHGPADVLAGRTDVTFMQSMPSVASELQRKYPAQLHSQALLNTIFLLLNPHIPPFDDVRARQAINAAIDRRTVVKLAGGSTIAVATCQLLPIGFPGHQTYCPYADADLAPRTAVAQALVRQSGTAETQVAVFGPQGRVRSALRGTLPRY
jgi:ABC-type transport system substrate-binding protein